MNDLKPQMIEPDDTEESGRRMDEELRSIGQMLRMLAQMEPEARGRVVAYLSARFPRP